MLLSRVTRSTWLVQGGRFATRTGRGAESIGWAGRAGATRWDGCFASESHVTRDIESIQDAVATMFARVEARFAESIAGIHSP